VLTQALCLGLTRLHTRWEFVTTLDYEWCVVRGRLPYRWTMWVRSCRPICLPPPIRHLFAPWVALLPYATRHAHGRYHKPPFPQLNESNELSGLFSAFCLTPYIHELNPLRPPGLGYLYFREHTILPNPPIGPGRANLILYCHQIFAYFTTASSSLLIILRV
jgi:hypothetical protein